jgi:hypothetical protein
MELQIVSFELAKKLKEAGFDIFGVEAYLENGELTLSLDKRGPLVIAPSLELAKMWFREKYNLLIEPTHYTTEHFTYNIYKRSEIITILKLGSINDLVNTYEEALEAGLLKAIELIK